jgi:thiol:disulfide interchange protein
MHVDEQVRDVEGRRRRVVLSVVVALVAVLLGGLWGGGGTAAASGLANIGGLGGFGGGGEDEVVTFETAWSHTAGEVGEPVVLAIVMDVAEGYSVTSHEAQAPAINMTVEVAEASPELGVSSAVFPEPHMKQVGPDRLSVLDGRSIIYVPMQVRDGEPGQTVAATIEVGWQACDDQVCLLPEVTTLAVELPIVEAGQAAVANAELFEGYEGAAPAILNLPLFGWDFQIDPTQLWVLLLVAALGGFLLNLTPCVLPLIPIKIMGLNQAAGTRGRTFALGLVMFAGVVAFWLGLGLIIATVSGFTAANQLFQYPAFTIGVGLIIAVMAVGMCGVFTVQLPQWVYRLNPSQESAHGSFGFGVMIAVLSTPCTAPFMGAAAAWAAAQSPALTLSTFMAIGVGMAMPYLVLAAYPQLTNRMPKAGPASELIKQVMGLLMLAAAAYFLGTGLSGFLATPPDPPTQIYWWAVGACVAAAGVWLAWRTWRIAERRRSRAFFTTFGVLLLVTGAVVGLRFSQDSPINWIYYTPERLAEAHERGDVVVLEFTAEWCLNCKALEQAVLHQREVVERLNAAGVAPIKVDLTGNNVAGNARLAKLGRQMIPLLVVFDRDGEEVFRSDNYTATRVLEALEQAGASAEATARR